jgi:hypothetical protein
MIAYYTTALPTLEEGRCEHAYCPRCFTSLGESDSPGPWCPGCDATWTEEEARCPHPATPGLTRGQSLCDGCAAMDGDDWAGQDEYEDDPALDGDDWDEYAQPGEDEWDERDQRWYGQWPPSE